MSKERIAGRALDAEVAERVMGWKPFPYLIHGSDGIELREGLSIHHCPPGQVHIGTVERVPDYSTDIAAAFQVVEAMRAKGYHMRLNCVHEGRDPGVAAFFPPWACRFIRVVDGYLSEPGHVMTAETPAHAICLSALAAIEAATPEKAPLKDSLSAPLPDTPRE